jgi:tRNA 2-thiouridine synthesizing protein E
MQNVQFAVQDTSPAAEWLLDSDGFLLDPKDWSRQFTEERAALEGITLNEIHWRLIDTIRDKYLRLGALPPMRSVCKSVGVDRYHLKSQFGNCLNLWKIAGLPHPGEEAVAYMH